MTIGRLRAKMAKIREEHEESETEGGELNLVPFLDIVTNVIMFLMMTTTFAAALADLNVTSPTIGSSDGSGASDQQNLNLTVQISDKGFIIAASGGVLYDHDVPGKLPTIPKTNNGKDYDFPALTLKLEQIKEQIAPNETKVIINANPDIRYQNLIDAMDAIRQKGSKILFPDVTLSAGVN